MKILFLLTALLSFTTCFAGIGMGEWQETTPCGNTIDNYSGNGYLLQLSPEGKQVTDVDNLKEWYFYKGYIIGELDRGENVYFVANEKTGEVHRFYDEYERLEYIEQNDLDPLIYTRWYTDDWLFFNSTLYLLLFLWFPLTLPLAGIFIFIVIGAVRELLAKSPQKTYCRIAGFIILWILVVWIGDVFPQSF